jgi:uncharacterized protein (TIGR02757 family)
MSEGSRGQLKKDLNDLYHNFDFKGRAQHDPIRFPMRYRNKSDVEAAAFVASALSYGRVELFTPVIENVLSVMGKNPYGFLQEFDVKKHGGLFEGISYRFQKNRDIICLLHIMGNVLRKHQSLERLFIGHFDGSSPDIGHALACMVKEMLNVDTAVVYGKNIRNRHPRGLIHLLPSPTGGGACKKLNLFLRWMVRDRDVDLGVWRDVPKNKLVIPLDTHIMEVSRRLGFTMRKTVNWKTALEITSALKALDAEDPLKYDFPLCHTGMGKFRYAKL